ncbi:hypothetical protein AMS68_001958 [Peltaster fructicola]|uniref:Uncharacterized protein n=1 Tax=Peltaster fructicola TaxID=286661 RepID=A0A6H0XP58_9PEZI|nr:hypothetical protein AMS68_001958 [Peltaster fructicola]
MIHPVPVCLVFSWDKSASRSIQYIRPAAPLPPPPPSCVQLAKLEVDQDLRLRKLNLRAILLAALPLITYTTALAADLQNDLRDVPDESIRAALEKTLAHRYREGVFEHNTNAIDALHNESPELASKVVEVAKQDSTQKLELMKRQSNTTTVTDSNVVVVATTVATTSIILDTTSSTPTTSSTSVAAASTAIVQTSQSQLLVPTVTPTTTSTTSVTPVVVISSASTSVVVPITTTNAQGSVLTTSSTVPAVVVSSTDSRGSVVTTVSPLSSAVVAAQSTTTTAAAAAVGSSNGQGSVTNRITTTDSYGQSITLTNVSPGATISTTDASGRAVVITYTPGGGVATNAVFLTTTLPDGERRTITTYETPGQATSTTAAAATVTSASVTPTLPAGSGTRYQAGGVAAVVGGAIGLLALI